MNKIPLIICGAYGRMGRACIELVLSSSRFVINNASARAGSSALKPSHWPFDITELPCFDGPCVLIDFSHHSLLDAHLKLAKSRGWAVLVGTTGHGQQNLAAMKRAADDLPVLYAPNTSIMANLLIFFSQAASKIRDVSAHILDIHHQGKLDAPSGTALAIKGALLENMNPERVVINSLRVADVVGEHRVSLFKENERLELCHQVSDRRIFAEGALIAAQFLYGQGPGLYDMNDVLNLK